VSQLCPEGGRSFRCVCISGIQAQPVSGQVYRHEGAPGPVWRNKYRLSDGLQVHRALPRAGHPALRIASIVSSDTLRSSSSSAIRDERLRHRAEVRRSSVPLKPGARRGGVDPPPPEADCVPRARHPALADVTDRGRGRADQSGELVDREQTVRRAAGQALLADEPITDDAFVTYEPLGVILAVMPCNHPFWYVLGNAEWMSNSAASGRPQRSESPASTTSGVRGVAARNEGVAGSVRPSA
jgi:hypothetical protein